MCACRDVRPHDEDGNTILRQLVVFTDGCDNKSDCMKNLKTYPTAIELQAALNNMMNVLNSAGPQLPRFYFTLIAVDEDGERQARIIREGLKTKHNKVCCQLGLPSSCVHRVVAA